LPGTLSFLPAAVHLLELLVRAMPSCSGDAWPLPGAGPKRPAALSRPLPPEPPAPPPAPELAAPNQHALPIKRSVGADKGINFAAALGWSA